ETLTCKTCVTPWHLNCLSVRPQTLADAAQWECPDCSNLICSHPPSSSTVTSGSDQSSSLIAAIRAIESDDSLTDQDKAKRRQQLLSGGGSDDVDKVIDDASGGDNDVLKLISGSFNCSFCMQLPERPVTLDVDALLNAYLYTLQTPCGHNFCLKCFEKWVGQGKRTCAICRTTIPPKMASQPRINSSLVTAIRMAKMTKSNTASGPPKPYYSVLNQNRPDKAYTTERAKYSGKANACSGKIFVTVAPDHFGPILAENDPERGTGVLVGETWEDRMDCRQWGVHLPHVSGIAGQSDYGAQSVALSGGYEDDEDHGEWFLYTGSGGRDLSGNKRTNKTQSFDQTFDKSNEALRVSCRKGYPVRVVRSHKEKRSAYAPEKGVRYDGIYRIEKCWRKPGIQGYKVCRYLFVRCDNDPAPWTSDENGDRPRPLPSIEELKDATDVTERKGTPSWDYDEQKACWLWKVPPPESRKLADNGDGKGGNSSRKARRKTQMSVSERLLKEFCCPICHKVMTQPLTTPCAHNFCKSCLQDAFAGQTFMKARTCGRRTLRAKKNIMKCPSCPHDISEYLQNPQVNRELMSVIESLQRQTKETEENAVSGEETSNSDQKSDDIKDENPETEVNNVNLEIGELGIEVMQDSKRKKYDDGICFVVLAVWEWHCYSAGKQIYPAHHTPAPQKNGIHVPDTGKTDDDLSCAVKSVESSEACGVLLDVRHKRVFHILKRIDKFYVSLTRTHTHISGMLRHLVAKDLLSRSKKKNSNDLPCDGDGRCMICKTNPPEEEKITCKTCVTPWHVDCLSTRPETLADAAQWECPDCSNLMSSDAPPSSSVASGSEPSAALVAAIRAIESDASLSDVEKAKRRQKLLSGGGSDGGDEQMEEKKEIDGGGGSSSGNDVLKLLSGSFNCSFCMQLPERPVTTPCGHNFCLKCFEKWVGQGKRTCAICRTAIPSKMASNPRINSSLVIAIRMAKMTRSNAASGPPKPYYSVLNQNKPDKAYTTERAKKTGKANACSGKIFVTVPPDHFGPISAENDPERGMGVLVGETWEDRLECRQWGAHLPHVAGICGQSDYGAQSVALSGGYEDDEDHGEWFLYTGSGGRDLSGNKRTNKTQSFDQKFDKSNEALRVSCRKGYPVRVVRSHKEKRSAYAPETGVRYDGVYRIEKCWRKPGIQGFKVCRYLFVRCDNDPAPWTSDEIGDRPRPLPTIKELKEATDVTERKTPPSWDYDEEKACWLWKIPPPESRKRANTGNVGEGTQIRTVRRKTHIMSVSERLLKEFCCLICHKVMNLPLTTPCAHNFCKSCLQDSFAGQTFIKERNCEGRRTLRAQKNIMKCPSCSNDISEYLQNPQVNRELMSVIESLQRQTKEMEENAVSEVEMLNADVADEDKAEAKAVNSEVDEDIKENDADETIAKPSPIANKETKAEADEDVKENEAIAKPSPKASKKRKAEGVTDNAPNKKLHPETDDMIGDAVNDNDNGINKIESEELKVDEVGKVAGAKTRSKKALA
ncbi:LOW QUALITY PROTEIN: hypothetical protein M8C21_004605, partial [Ambrosia artemisiifolia]